MNIKKNILVTLLLVSNAVMAQTPDMATAMRANGKIYVVVGVLAIIFAGIACYLFGLDKKITALEKKLNK
jgi:CcmD family protein